MVQRSAQRLNLVQSVFKQLSQSDRSFAVIPVHFVTVGCAVSPPERQYVNTQYSYLLWNGETKQLTPYEPSPVSVEGLTFYPSGLYASVKGLHSCLAQKYGITLGATRVLSCTEALVLAGAHQRNSAHFDSLYAQPGMLEHLSESQPEIWIGQLANTTYEVQRAQTISMAFLIAVFYGVIFTTAVPRHAWKGHENQTHHLSLLGAGRKELSQT